MTEEFLQIWLNSLRHISNIKKYSWLPNVSLQSVCIPVQLSKFFTLIFSYMYVSLESKIIAELSIYRFLFIFKISNLILIILFNSTYIYWFLLMFPILPSTSFKWLPVAVEVFYMALIVWFICVYGYVLFGKPIWAVLEYNTPSDTLIPW